MSAGSDVVVITSGMPRKPGMSRDDLVQTNYNIMQAVTEQVVKLLAELHHRPGRQPARRDVPGGLPPERFPRERVIGMAGVLDSARMRTFLAMELNVSVEDVHGVRARRPRRRDGAAAALLDGRRRAAHRDAAGGSHRGDLRSARPAAAAS